MDLLITLGFSLFSLSFPFLYAWFAYRVIWKDKHTAKMMLLHLATVLSCHLIFFLILFLHGLI